MRRRIGEYLVDVGVLTPTQRDHLLDIQRTRAPTQFLGTLAIEHLHIDPETLAYYLDTGAISLSAEDLEPAQDAHHTLPFQDLLRTWGGLYLGTRRGDPVIGVLRWPPRAIRATVEWSLSKRVVWVLLPPNEWWTRFPPEMDPTIGVSGLEWRIAVPWELRVIESSGDNLWVRQLQTMIRLRQPVMTVRERAPEAWVDFHTLDHPLQMIPPDDFATVWQTACTGMDWGDAVFFPDRAGFWWVTIRQRRLAWLMRYRAGPHDRAVATRFVDPGRERRHWRHRMQRDGTEQALRTWLTREDAPGVWLWVAPRSVLSAWAMMMWLETLNDLAPTTWIIHDRRRGVWAESLQWMPLPALWRHLESSPRDRVGIVVEWDGTPQMLQNVLIASARHPIVVRMGHMHPIQALHRIWRLGFASALRAGRIRGWTAVVAAPDACTWCRDVYTPRYPDESLPETAWFRVEPTDLGWIDRGCSACAHRAWWQHATMMREQCFLPAEDMRGMEQWHDWVTYYFERVQAPLHLQVIEAMRSRALHTRWGLRYLRGLLPEESPTEE